MQGSDLAAGGFSPRPSTAWKAFNLISRVLNPIYLTPPAILAISLEVSPTALQGLKWFSIYIVFSTVIPLADLAWRRKTGRISDWHISRREERSVPLVFGLGYALAGTLSMYLLDAPTELVAAMVSGLAVGLTALLITLGWKISLHTMGNALLATLIALVFAQCWYSPLNLLLALGVVVTGTSRIYLKQHTPWQVVAGTAVGVAVGVGVFAAFGLL
jgi:membrane-associated phospholipid phosphatase